jgi:hypothetical protein
LHGHGTLMTPSSGRPPSSAVESAITGMLALCGVLLPMAPTKASRTPSSSLGARSSRSAPSSSSSTTLWGRHRLGWCGSRSPQGAHRGHDLPPCLRRGWLSLLVGGVVALRLAPCVRDLLLGLCPYSREGRGFMPRPSVVVVCFTSLGYLRNLKLATCVVPSISFTLSWRQVPAQALSDFQT